MSFFIAESDFVAIVSKFLFMWRDFIQGISLVPKGFRAFYRDKNAWRYAAFPWVIMLIVYVFAFGGVICLSKWSAKNINELLVGLPSWLEWVHRGVDGLSLIIGIVFALLLLGTTVCTFYEIFGGLFFDSLVEYYEKKTFGITPRRFVLTTEIRYGVQSLWFGIKTTFVFVFWFFIGLFFPVAGQIFLVVVMGYYMGLSYMIASANNNHCTIRQLQRAATQNFPSLLGFGITAYLLLMIPFATLIFLPGLTLGGTMLYHEKIKEYV